MSEAAAARENKKKQLWLFGSGSDMVLTKLQEKGWQAQARVAEKIGVNKISNLN